MKIINQLKSGAKSFRALAFTLVEMIMVVGIFLFIFVGVMTAVQIFGLRIYTLEATKLVATQGARSALNALRDEIRGSKNVYIGNCTAPNTNSFTLVNANSTNMLQGNAIIVYPTTNSNWYYIYYLDTSTGTNILTQFNVTNGSVYYTTQLASYITNQIIFDAENYQGTVGTNYTALDNREIIKVTMQFSQWEYPIAFVGGVGFNAYDYYQLRTRVFRRAWN
jgi:type II secretory pathway pseudopilin PulG